MAFSDLRSLLFFCVKNVVFSRKCDPWHFQTWQIVSHIREQYYIPGLSLWRQCGNNTVPTVDKSLRRSGPDKAAEKNRPSHYKDLLKWLGKPRPSQPWSEKSLQLGRVDGCLNTLFWAIMTFIVVEAATPEHVISHFMNDIRLVYPYLSDIWQEEQMLKRSISAVLTGLFFCSHLPFHRISLSYFMPLFNGMITQTCTRILGTLWLSEGQGHLNSNQRIECSHVYLHTRFEEKISS